MHPAVDEGAPPGNRLNRVLGTVFGLAVSIGVTVGVGILRTPGEIAAQLPTLPLYAAVWLLGGAYALFGALSLAELGAMLPRSGGQYVAARHTFGAYAGFVVGWNDWISTCGTIAAVAIVLAESASQLFPVLTPATRAIAVAAVILLLVLQLRGTGWAAEMQTVASVVKAIGFVFLIAACLLWRGAPAPLEPSPERSAFALAASVVAALQSVIFTYDGWTGPLYFAGEMREPGRDLPRAMRGGVAGVIALYALINAALLHVLGLGGMRGVPLVAADAAGVVFGRSGHLVVAAVVLLAMVGAASANLLMAPRVLYALARDGFAAAGAARIDAGGTPGVAAAISALVAIGFVLSRTFDSVLALLAFLFVGSYVISFSAVFVLRRREPGAHRPYRAWGFPVTTGIVLLGSVAFLAGALVTDTRNSLIAVGLVAFSYVPYRALRRRGRVDDARGGHSG